MKRLLIHGSVWLYFALFFTPANLLTAQVNSVICPVIQLDFASGSCTSTAKTQYSLMKAYSAQGERAWAKFDISGVPDSVTITDVKIHYFIDNQTYPYFVFTKLALDPVSSSANSIYTHIGLASSSAPLNSNTYLLNTNNQQGGWNINTLNNFARTDLQNQLLQGWFAIGLWEYETYGNYFLNCHGWNETNKPYLEVSYIPINNNNDIWITAFSPTGTLCADTMPISIVVTNSGINVINSVQINLTFNNLVLPAYIHTFPLGLAPGSTDTVELGDYFFSPAYYSVSASVSMPNGLVDPNPFNNALQTFAYFLNSPLVSYHPEDTNVSVGANVFFQTEVNYAYTFQWQLSTDNGTSFTDLSNTIPYFYVDSSRMYVQAVQLSMDGHQFRCRVESDCGVLFTDPAILTVTTDTFHIYQIYADPDSVCTGYYTQLHVVPLGGTGVYTFSWTSDPPGFTSNLQEPSVNQTQNTLYTCVVTDGTNTLSAYCWVFIMPAAGAAGPISGPSGVCKTQQVITYTVSPIANAWYYYWTFPSGMTGFSNTNHISLTIGNNSVSGTITVKAYNSCGYGAISSKQITVYSSPIVNAGPDQTIFAGATAVLTATATSGTAPYNYHWSNGVNTASITVTPTMTTTYSVTVTDANGCTGMDHVVVTVNPVINLMTYLVNVNHCPGNILVPIYVNNFYSVASISLSLHFDTNHLIFNGYQGVNAQLSGGTLLINSTANAVQIAWFSITPANIGNGTLLNLKFIADSGNSSINWDLVTQGACVYTDLNNLPIPTTFINGTVTIPNCSNAEGFVRYFNNQNTPMTTTPVLLKQNGVTAYQTLTDSNGFYYFNNLATATYETHITPLKPWGGVNASDALLILKHFIGLTTFSGIVFKAGDVDQSNAVNSADALQVAKRFVNMISSFPAGDWVYQGNTFTVNGNGNSFDSIPVLCSGDVDRSYFPPVAKISPDIQLAAEENLTAKLNQIITIPFYSDKALEVGSISAVMEFNSDYIHLLDVKAIKEGYQFYTYTGNTIRFAWFGLDPIRIQAGEELFHLVCSVEKSTGSLAINPSTEFEITDTEGIPFSEIKLSYPVPQLESPKDLLGQNIPNPFITETEIPYQISAEAQVQILVYDYTGKAVQTLINKSQAAGSHTVRFSSAGLAPGIYNYRLTVTQEDGVHQASRKLIIK